VISGAVAGGLVGILYLARAEGALFVAGVMNLLWVAAISVLVLVEKIAPAGQRVSWAAGFLLIGWGVWTAARAIPAP
jgi:predicted metal-binding membrane protein